MPAVDLVESVRSGVEKNLGIPAMLDAYGQFVDSPLGDLELSKLDDVFSAILQNLETRYPQVASQRASVAARNDISTFLQIANRNSDRVRDALRIELEKAIHVMGLSISERVARTGPDEKRAIDATLRLMRRSPVEIIFRAEAGKPISASASEFERFFASIKSESPGTRELRYQNLIVEKGIFNKLLLKSPRQDYSVWIPSYFAKASVDFLIEKNGIMSDHLLSLRLRELKEQGRIDGMRPFLNKVTKSLGVLSKGEEIPDELKDFVFSSQGLTLISPVELDDIFLFLEEEEEIARKSERLREETKRKKETSELEARQREERARLEKRVAAQVARTEENVAQSIGESVYLGKKLDFEHLVPALSRKIGDVAQTLEVKELGDYWIPISAVKSNGVSIVGSSGSGRSTSLERILDGLGKKNSRIILLDDKGEYRSIATRYGMQVFALTADFQSRQFRIPLRKFVTAREPELFADMIEEWCHQTGVDCSDQQRIRISVITQSLSEPTVESFLGALAREPQLELIGKKLSKGLLAADALSRIFSEKGGEFKIDGSFVFDISGRGLRNPTTREERLLISVMLLKEFEDEKVGGAIILLEDALDRFKSESLKKDCLGIVTRLKNMGNSIVSTSRSQVKEFVGANCIEIVHRLSGEKTINDIVAGFRLSQDVRGLSGIVSRLPRGYALTSEITQKDRQILRSELVRIEPLS